MIVGSRYSGHLATRLGGDIKRPVETQMSRNEPVGGRSVPVIRSDVFPGALDYDITSHCAGEGIITVMFTPGAQKCL